MEPLLNSDKSIQTPEQIIILQHLYFQAENASIPEILAFHDWVKFTPTQEWIDKFEYVGLRFYPDRSVDYTAFDVKHYSVEGPDPAPGKLWDGPVPPKPEPSWVPQNGEWVEGQNYQNAQLYEGVYIGSFHEPGTTIEHVVRTKYGTYALVNDVRPKPKKVQVPLDELLSVYASVKGLTQDGVELKAEN